MNYLYFYSDGPLPTLLSIAIQACLKNAGPLLLATTHELFNQLPSHIKSSSNLLFRVVTARNVYEDPRISQYVRLINSGVIVSNHPPTEVHCIYRWIFLHTLMLSGDIDSAFSFDWDTILLPRSNSIIDACNSSLVVHLDNCDYTHPVFIFCPHAAYVNIDSVSLYLYYLEYYLLLASKRNFLPLYFSDIPPWSSVISRLLLSGSIVEDWNRVGNSLGMYCCSNIRDDGGPVLPKRRSFLIDDPSYNYLPEGQTHLSVHDYYISNSLVMLQAKRQSSETLEKFIAPWIHFSGTEGKYIFFKYYLNDLVTRELI